MCVFNLKAADAFLMRLKDEAVSVFDVDIVLGQGRGETLEIADFVGDRDCQNIL